MILPPRAAERVDTDAPEGALLVGIDRGHPVCSTTTIRSLKSASCAAAS